VGTLSLVFGIILIVGGIFYLILGIFTGALFDMFVPILAILLTTPGIIMIVIGAKLIQKYDRDRN